MGTNYYAKTPDTPSNGLHIGKSSAGWAFALRIHPELGIKSLQDWMDRIVTERLEIYDEYGTHVTLGELVETICNRKRPTAPDINYSENHAIANPANHLIRSRLRESGGDRFAAVSHEATWDVFDHTFC